MTILRCGLTSLLLCACAAAPPRHMVVEYLAVTNPDAICGPGVSYCTLAKPNGVCAIVTPARAVSYSGVGALVRECWERI